MTSLPFSQEIKKGRQRWRILGILTIGADGVGIEWRSDEFRRKRFRRKLDHLGRGDVHVMMIPWTFIDAVSYHGALFGAGRIRLRARTMNAFDGLPNADGPYWEVKISSPDRSRAREFVLAAEGAVSSAVQLLGHRTRV
ncbi:MAG TPA: hypothetical protein VGM82_04245 [Gemmatimonadaceae bacterium]|jgi:hypothetical protein